MSMKNNRPEKQEIKPLRFSPVAAGVALALAEKEDQLRFSLLNQEAKDYILNTCLELKPWKSVLTADLPTAIAVLFGVSIARKPSSELKKIGMQSAVLFAGIKEDWSNDPRSFKHSFRPFYLEVGLESSINRSIDGPGKLKPGNIVSLNGADEGEDNNKTSLVL